MADKSKIRYDDFINKVQSDPAKPESTIMLSGFVGRGPDGHARIYPDPTLGTWYDVAEDDVVHSMPIADSKLGGSYVWVRASAQIKPGSAAAGAGLEAAPAPAPPRVAITPQPTPATHCFICPPHTQNCTPATIRTHLIHCPPQQTLPLICTLPGLCPPNVTPATVCTQPLGCTFVGCTPHCPGGGFTPACLPPPTPPTVCPPHLPTPQTQCLPFCDGGLASAVCPPPPPPTPITLCPVCTQHAVCVVGQTASIECMNAPQLRLVTIPCPTPNSLCPGCNDHPATPDLPRIIPGTIGPSGVFGCTIWQCPTLQSNWWECHTQAAHCTIQVCVQADPRAAGAAPQAVGINPTPATHCFVCDPKAAAAIQPTPTAQTHCFICPPHTQAFNCPTQPVICDTMQMPTPATRCFICPPLHTQQVWCPTRPVVCNLQHTQPVVCGFVPPSHGCQQGAAPPQPEAVMAAAAPPNTQAICTFLECPTNYGAGCTASTQCIVCPTPYGSCTYAECPQTIACPTMLGCPTKPPDCLTAPIGTCAQAPQVAAAAMQPAPHPTPFCTIPPNCPAQTGLVPCPTQPGACTLPVQCYQPTWFGCPQGGAQQHGAAMAAAAPLTLPPWVCGVPTHNCQQGGGQQQADAAWTMLATRCICYPQPAAAAPGPAQTAATLCTQACFPTLATCPTNIGVCPTVMTGCWTAPSGLCAFTPTPNGVFTPFGR